MALEHLNQQCAQCWASRPPHVTIIQNWLEKMKDRLGIVHEIVTKLGTCGMKAGVRKQWPWGRQPIFEAADWLLRGRGPIQEIVVSLPPYSSSLTGAEWPQANWWEDSIAAAWYAIQKTAEAASWMHDIKEGVNVMAPIKRHITKQSIFIVLFDLMCLKYGKLSNSMTLERFLALTVSDPFNMGGIRLEKYMTVASGDIKLREWEKDPSYSEQKPYWPFSQTWVDLSSLNCIVFSQSFWLLFQSVQRQSAAGVEHWITLELSEF